MLTDQL